MMRCKNNGCRHRRVDGVCEVSRRCVIGNDGICESFEKGFIYYFYYFTRVLSSNFICLPELDDDLRYSIYYLMKCLPIEFAVDTIRGMLLLRDKETGNLLNCEGILNMIRDKLDNEALQLCIDDFHANGLLVIESDEESEDIEMKEYGWLSPAGKYIEAEWGNHSVAAHDIVDQNNWIAEYREWRKENKGEYYPDFLSQVKGYALIHDPSGLQRYIVTHMKPLTKKQKEFLYGFFKDMGMTLRAEEFLEDL